MAVKKNVKPTVNSKKRKGGSKSSSRSGCSGSVAGWVTVLLLALGVVAYIFSEGVRVRIDTGLSALFFDNTLPVVPLRDSLTVYGIDLSRYQGDVNWDELCIIHKPDSANEDIHTKVSFVFLKASMGGGKGISGDDPNYAKNLKEARARGFLVGAYHVYRADKPADQQAKVFLDKANLSSTDLPPVLDLEANMVGKNRNLYREGVLEWLKIVEDVCGARPIIYTSDNCRRDIFCTPDFDKYKFWIARYTMERPQSCKDWVFWQFTEKGRVSGINHKVDINAFNGTEADLKTLSRQAWPFRTFSD